MTIASSRQLRYVANSRQLPIPRSLDWLSNAERSELSFWSNEIRRHQWIAGRWIAKRMIASTESCEELCQVEILSRGKDGLGTSPRLFIGGISQRSRLSISHSGNSILVGWAGKGHSLGVDLAVAVPHTDSFLTTWYSPNERTWISTQPKTRAAVLWGLKESIFKACGEGLKWNPASIAIDAFDNYQVHGKLQGRSFPPLRTWVRDVTGGIATAVWNAEDNKEVITCS